MAREVSHALKDVLHIFLARLPAVLRFRNDFDTFPRLFQNKIKPELRGLLTRLHK